MAVDVYDEQYRPQFHFSAKKGWLNDPNGLVYFDGTYHLFYQHNPFGENWGNMTWGHATSPDLVHWSERSPALAADPTGVKFSGTAVIDYNNTAGLQTGDTPTMALFYTSVGSFDQRMAYSNDGGRSFQYYEGNPILPSISSKDDRDPQVFWHEPSNKWIQTTWMAPYDGKPQSFQFYGSTNLTDWTYLSETPDFYECPDFFELPVNGDANNKKWVLYGADGRYQIGGFDGTSFTAETPSAGTLPQDYGAHFYAAQTWHDIPSDDGRRIQVTWMNGAQYPGMPFNQQMGFPTELTLRDTPDGVRMYHNPVEEISLLHGDKFSLTNQGVRPGQDPLLGQLNGDLFHIKADIEIGAASTLGFNVRGNEVRYDVATQTLSALGRSAPLAPVNGRLELELLVDRSSLELFGGGGRVSMTSGFLPSPSNTSINWFSTGGTSKILSLSAFELKSAWPDEQPQAGPGLLGHWSFDDPQHAANFVDDGNGDYSLANSGLKSAVSGRVGNAADLDNADDYAYVPNQTALNADNFSASVWLRPNSLGSDRHVLGKLHDQTQTWGVEQLADGRLEFSVSTGVSDSDTVQTNVPVNVNQWNHAVTTYNAETGRLELYLNGLFAGASEGVVTGSPLYDDNPLMLGRRLYGGGGSLGAVDAQVDELQLYGSALSPGQVGYLYQNPGESIDPTTFEVSTLKLQVDPQSGAAKIVSIDGSVVALKGYSIFSTEGDLNVQAWQSLQSAGVSGWEEANPSGAVVSELNPLDSRLIDGANPVQVGRPVAVAGHLPFGVKATNLDVSFQYLTAAGKVINGPVELIGPYLVNNLVLEIDPSTGETWLTNESPYTVSLRGYSILSESGSLLPGNSDWNSLSDQGTPGVDEANPTSHALSELAAFNGDGISMLPGESFSLGAAFKVESAGGTADLELEFVYEQSMAVQGDYNQDGQVDAADYTVWRDAMVSGEALPNEGAAGQVTAEDYTVWRNHYGEMAPVTQSLRRGVVSYVESSNASLDSGVSTPEPSSLALAIGFTLSIAAARRTIEQQVGMN